MPIAHPAPGRVEQDPRAGAGGRAEAVAEVLDRRAGREVIAAGIDHQGESVLAWEAESGRALTPMVVWQDKRQQELLAGIDPRGRRRSGLPLDPYFSAGKLDLAARATTRAVARAREEGSLRLGTVEAYLSERLGERLRDRPLDRLADAAARRRRARLGRRAAGPLRRAARVAAGGSRPSYGELGELRSERWPVALPAGARGSWTSRRRWPARGRCARAS